MKSQGDILEQENTIIKSVNIPSDNLANVTG